MHELLEKVWDFLKYMQNQLSLQSQDLLTVGIHPDGLEIRIVWFRGKEAYYFNQIITDLILSEFLADPMKSKYALDRFFYHAKHHYNNYMEDFKRKME